MFLTNIVLGAAALAAGLRLLPREAGDRAVRIDALGSALLAACMLGLLSGLIQGSTDGWTAAPVAALAAGVIFFAAFAQRQRTAAAPLIKPSLLRNRGFTAGLILGLVFFATVAGLFYAVSLFLQRGAGYSPERAAVTGFAPAAAGIVIASVACRNLVTRLGRRLSLAGIVVTVGSVAVLEAIVAHSGTAASAAELAPAMTLIGLGMGATFSTIYDIPIGDIDPAEAGSASGSLSSGPAAGQRDRRGRHHHHLLWRASRRPGARHDPQPAHGHRHRRAELPGHPAAATPRPARPPALTSWHRHQAAMRVPNVPPITWRGKRHRTTDSGRQPQPALRIHPAYISRLRVRLLHGQQSHEVVTPVSSSGVRSPVAPHRRPQQSPAPRPGSMNRTLDELTDEPPRGPIA